MRQQKDLIGLTKTKPKKSHEHSSDYLEMLADDLIQEDAGFVKTLSRSDIEFLFG